MTTAAGSLWITAYTDGVLAQVDPATNTITRHRIGVQPCGITYAGGWLWVARLGTADIARVSPRTGKVTKVVPFGGQAWDVQHSAGAVWVSDRTGNRVLRLDPHTGPRHGPRAARLDAERPRRHRRRGLGGATTRPARRPGSTRRTTA